MLTDVSNLPEQLQTPSFLWCHFNRDRNKSGNKRRVPNISSCGLSTFHLFSEHSCLPEPDIWRCLWPKPRQPTKRLMLHSSAPRRSSKLCLKNCSNRSMHSTGCMFVMQSRSRNGKRNQRAAQNSGLLTKPWVFLIFTDEPLKWGTGWGMSQCRVSYRLSLMKE